MNIRPATPADVPLVARILSAAARRLLERGQALWSEAEVGEPGVAPHVREGLYYIGFDDGEPVGVFRFQLQDRGFWPEIPDGTSAYVHKLAVLPERQGQGHAHALLRQAALLARQYRLQFLRLDCMADRAKLRALYEGFGCRHHSRVQLGQAWFDRFELAL